MRNPRTLATAVLVTLALALTACGNDSNKSDLPTGAERSNSDNDGVRPPAGDQSQSRGGSSENTDGGTNANSPSDLVTDGPRYQAAMPCRVINAADLYGLFHSTFILVDDDDPNNGNDSPVTDHSTMQRACGYTTPNAMLDDGNRTKLGNLQVIITTQLDDTKGTVWDAYIYAASVNNGTVLSDSLIQFGTGHFVTKVEKPQGSITVEVEDQNGELNDKGAKDILGIATKRLS